jgi:hypothetical protein
MRRVTRASLAIQFHSRKCNLSIQHFLSADHLLHQRGIYRIFFSPIEFDSKLMLWFFQHLRERLLDDVGDSFFSILVDETTGILVVETLHFLKLFLAHLLIPVLFVGDFQTRRIEIK